MARTSRSTGGTSMLCRATPGTAGATTTLSGLTHINNCSMRTGRRGKLDPEYELLDTGIFDDDRYWVVDVQYAKADPTDILMTISVTNAGPDTELLHVLPTMWYRNTWSWDTGATRPTITATSDRDRGRRTSVPRSTRAVARTDPQGAYPELLFCDNDTNLERLYGVPSSSRWPKDGINDHVVSGADTVNPERRGTKCAAWYRLTVGPGETAQVRLRLRPEGTGPDAATALGADFTRVEAQRRNEADEFYAELTPAAASSDEAAVMRQAFAGMLWNKQFYNYNVARWLDGDPSQPPPPPQRRHGRNARWRSFEAFDVMSMPDTWEYPWFATWDMAFHCVALVHVDPAFAKYQLSLLCREWFQNPNGALPAYEWDSTSQPAGTGVGRAGSVRHRRRSRLRLPQPHLRQAAGELHLVGESRRRQRLQPL